MALVLPGEAWTRAHEIVCAMTFSCQHCGQHIAAEASMAGVKTPCPACGKELVIPAPAEPKVDAPAPRPAAATQGSRNRIVFSCPKCAHRMEIDTSKAGTSMRCPVCALMFLAPKAAPSKSGHLVRSAYQTLAGLISTRPNKPAPPPPQKPLIEGTWLITPGQSASLGTQEMLVRKVGDAIAPEMSLVVSRYTIVQRYKKPSTASFSVLGVGGRTLPVVKDPDGTEYFVSVYVCGFDTAVTPPQINLHAADGGLRLGIYKIENNRLWLSLDTATRPLDFQPDDATPSKLVIKATRID